MRNAEMKKMRMGLRLVALLAVLCGQWLMAQEAQAQDENAAFYIYQNNGHFDGFFYDEVQKISYSKLDTLGIEHEDYVSQEIVTADSTYRVMLAAIDSVSFVQPEIIMNPRLRDMIAEGMRNATFGWNLSDPTITFFDQDLTEAQKPKVGDVLLYNAGDVFCRKVSKVTSDGFWMTVETEPIDDVSDVYQQFITVEEYSHDRNGKLVARRVAGAPHLNRGRYVPRYAQGDWNDDIFDFSFNGHFPLGGDDIDVTLDLNVEGAVNVKAVWNIPVLGTKYVGLTTTIGLEAGLGLTVDGKLGGVMEGKLGKAASIPLPSAVPLFELTLAPNNFIRGDAHLTLNVQTPKAKGKLWSKLELIDWWPYLDFGFGNPPGANDDDEEEEENNGSATYSLNGYLQTGIMFPCKFGTHSFLQKFLQCEIGTTMYVGPKISGEFSIDLANAVFGDNSWYGNRKDSHLTLCPLSADYETTGTMKSFWGSEKEITFNDGSFELKPKVDLYFLPHFDKWSEDGDSVFTKPVDNVVLPVAVGYAVFGEDENGNQHEIYQNWKDDRYYQLSKTWLNTKERIAIAKKDIEMLPYNYDPYEKYNICPIFQLAFETIQASPVYEFYPKNFVKFERLAPLEAQKIASTGGNVDLLRVTGKLDGVTIDTPISNAFNGNPVWTTTNRVVNFNIGENYGIAWNYGSYWIDARTKVDGQEYTLASNIFVLDQEPSYRANRITFGSYTFKKDGGWTIPKSGTLELKDDYTYEEGDATVHVKAEATLETDLGHAPGTDLPSFNSYADFEKYVIANLVQINNPNYVRNGKLSYTSVRTWKEEAGTNADGTPKYDEYETTTTYTNTYGSTYQVPLSSKSISINPTEMEWTPAKVVTKKNGVVVNSYEEARSSDYVSSISFEWIAD